MRREHVRSGLVLAAVLCVASAEIAYGDILACGSVVAPPGATLTAPVVGCSGTALQVQAGAVLDLGGYLVSCADKNVTTNIGIKVDGDGTAVIRNGLVSNCRVGVKTDTGEITVEVENVVAEGNNVGFMALSGIARNNRFQSCVARGNDDQGFYLTIYGKILECTAADNGGNGFEGARIYKDSVAVGNGGAGFYLRTDSARVSGCTATGNAGHGFHVELASGVRINRSTAVGNGGSGMRLDTDVNKILNATARANDGDGITLGAGADRNRLKQNSLLGNASDGIDAAAATSENQIEINTAYGNSIFDLRDGNGDCSANAWTSNDFGDASPACIE